MDQQLHSISAQLGKDLDLFTERARASLDHAEQEARGTFNHNYLGTEHLLLGLVDVEDGVAAKVLGIPAETVRQAICNIVGKGSEPFSGEIGLTPRAKHVLDLARQEARQLSHLYIGTEHLLLGLVREGEGIAAGILAELRPDLDLDKTRAEILRVLNTAAKGNVITCRVWARDLDTIDLLVEAGIRGTRSDAAAWLIHAGIEANRDVFERIHATVAEIRRLRQQAQAMSREMNFVVFSPAPAAPAVEKS